MKNLLRRYTETSTWNKGKLIGQKLPLKLKEIWAIRIRLQIQNKPRNLALFNLGIDSKLRACDLVKLRVNNICHGRQVMKRAAILQQKTKLPVQFEITLNTRASLNDWIKLKNLSHNDYLFPSRVK